MNILITICARGGSKGVPGKNIKPVAGKPLLLYTIAVAEAFANIYDAKIILSTDSDEIRELGRGSSVFCDYERPPVTATDTAGKVDAIAHAASFMESKFETIYDYILDLDITSPLRTLSDLDNAFKLLQSDEEALNIFSVSKASRNPYFNMVERKENGYYNSVKSIEQNLSVKSRQAAPLVYDMNASFYFYRRKFFETNQSSALTSKSLIYEMDHVCFDIDEPLDFDFMDFFLNNYDFNFFK